MRYLLALVVVFVAVSSSALAAADFAGPAGWSPVAVPVSNDTTRSYKQWHLGDVATVTYIKDASVPYADALGTITKNFSTNNIKATTDRDVPCQGKTAHMIEFTTGPDGHRIVINRMLVPDGNGVQTITYTRQDGSVFDNDVKKAETEFCSGS